ncbi:MAG: 50S ribosomal protein L23 [Ruminococcaceae bacterium]|nr:50S ribosomal protein L23 [Oscillospiraceae bacterium]
MTFAHDIIIRPVISEHSMEQMENRTYTFEVKIDANKIQIANAIEEIFGVKVEKVTTIRMQGKMKRMGAHQGRRASYKKAMIKLTEDSKTIEFFEGMAQ